MDTGISFSRWLRQRRRALDLTQADLAAQVGCAPDTLRKIEAGSLRPSRQIAERLADLLVIPDDERTTLSSSRCGPTSCTAPPSIASWPARSPHTT